MAQSWKAGEARRGTLAWPLGCRNPGVPRYRALAVSGSMLASNSQQGLLPSLTLLDEENEGQPPPALQGRDFPQAAGDELGTFQEARGPGVPEARPATREWPPLPML